MNESKTIEDTCKPSARFEWQNLIVLFRTLIHVNAFFLAFLSLHLAHTYMSTLLFPTARASFFAFSLGSSPACQTHT